MSTCQTSDVIAQDIDSNASISTLAEDSWHAKGTRPDHPFLLGIRKF